MEKNVKIIIGIVISLIGIIVLGSDYYLSLKHEVFDDMNKKYYEQNVVVDDLPDEIDDDQINSGDISENDDKPQNITTVLISVSHSKEIGLEEIKNTIKDKVLTPVLLSYKKMIKNTNYIINPSGKFTIWGSFSDSGCVGRKIVVDTYGGLAKVGGGCFSSKNASKVDRSGAYYARYVAKNIVAHKLADRCEIGVSYGIGLKKPISIYIDTFGTEKVELKKIYDYVSQNFDFSPQNIISELDLNKPIYKNTACFGHFVRDEFSWERIKN